MTQTINNLKDIKVNLKEMDRKMDRWEQNLILSPMTKKSPAPTPKSPSTKLIKSPKTTSSPTPNKKSPSSPTPNKKSPTKKSPTKKSPTKKSPTKKSPPKKEQKKKTGVNKIKKPRIFPMKRKKTIKTRGVYVITLAPPVTEIKKVNFTKKKLIVVVN